VGMAGRGVPPGRCVHALRRGQQQVDADEVRGVLGDAQVYYEWRNESDLTGRDSYVPPDKYVASWNATVPQLKAVANPGAKFMRPAGFQLNSSATGYLSAFLSGARPQPDAISWHEDTCNDKTQGADYCLGAIDKWPLHIAAARSVMDSTIHTQLPMRITEWIYTPDIVASDAKHTDESFLRQWPTKALQTLAESGIAASMHFRRA
jgi:hypothetical protein